MSDSVSELKDILHASIFRWGCSVSRFLSAIERPFSLATRARTIGNADRLEEPMASFDKRGGESGAIAIDRGRSRARFGY